MIPFEKIHLVRRFRFLFEYLRKGSYKVYYLSKNEEIVGYCVTVLGGGRLTISTEKDIVLGPYYVDPIYRSLGYAKVLVQMVLKYCSFDYEYAFDWIHKSNIASIKTSEACGMYVDGKLDVVGKFRRLVPNENGAYLIYKYKKQS